MLTFVLSGGGARGAYQVGAMRALIENGHRPEIVVGTSVGALNAAYLAFYGFSAATLDGLADIWRQAAVAELLVAKRAWLAARALFNRHDRRYALRMRSFLIGNGMTPDLHFGQAQHARLIVVATDLNSGQPVLYGQSPYDNVLEAILASAALPPWVPPVHDGKRLLVDGGVVSNLPIEAALLSGADRIIALDVSDSRGLDPEAEGMAALVSKVAATAAARQMYLELALARAQNVPVQIIKFQGEAMVPVWDFSHTEDLITHGYEMAKQTIADWDPAPSSVRPVTPRRRFQLPLSWKQKRQLRP